MTENTSLRANDHVPSTSKSTRINGIVVFCAIVSIVTCCFSVNLAAKHYERSAKTLRQVHRQLRQKQQASLLDQQELPSETQIVSKPKNL